MTANQLELVNFVACVTAALSAIYLGQMLLLTKDDPPIWVHIQRVMLALMAVMFMLNSIAPTIEDRPPSPLKTGMIAVIAVWFILRAFMRHRGVKSFA
jgi:hypothetical protein